MKSILIPEQANSCRVKNFKLVKVLLPTSVIKELKENNHGIIGEIKNTSDFIVFQFNCVPCEEDESATNIRYVIEGEIEYE